MTKEQIKALVREKLSTKRIILFGAGIIAEEFYEEHKDMLNISHCVSNYEKEWGEGFFLGKLDVKKYRREEIGENDYIVACGPFAFRTIELQLKAEGLKMYVDYIESKIATAIYANKKIALFYGQCILRDIHQCIVQVPAFTKEYISVFTQTTKGQAVVNNRLLYYLKDICDVYVYTPKILDRDSAYSLSKHDLPDECKIVSVSNLVMPLYWPEIDGKLDGYNEYYIYSYNSRRDSEFYHTLYRKSDLNINKMVSEGKTTREIVECLTLEEFYSEKQVKRNTNTTLKMIDIAEKDVDVKIADYIRNNYKKIMLFQNYIHPNKCIIWEYVRRILNVLGVSIEEINCLENESPLHIHQGGDVPIYPSVAKYMELEFVNEKTQYEIITGNGLVYMTFAEYTEHYVEYTRKAIEIMQM